MKEEKRKLNLFFIFIPLLLHCYHKEHHSSTSFDTPTPTHIHIPPYIHTFRHKPHSSGIILYIYSTKWYFSLMHPLVTNSSIIAREKKWMGHIELMHPTRTRNLFSIGWSFAEREKKPDQNL